MTFEDARKILNGGDTAATEYFRAKTSESLTAAFRPVVTDSMKDVGVMQQYKQLQSAYQSVPFASSFQAPDIEAYVVSKALDGLFLVLGEQEKKIRTNPAAQVTDLLKKVFGKINPDAAGSVSARTAAPAPCPTGRTPRQSAAAPRAAGGRRARSG